MSELLETDRLKQQETACSCLRRFLSLVKETPLSSSGALVRLQIEAPDLDALTWLGSLTGVPRYYWRDRNGTVEMAGVGEADVLDAQGGRDIEQVFALMQERLKNGSEGIRYYGGFRFHSSPARHGLWRDYQAHRFVIPLLEYCRENEKAVFAAAVKDDGGRRKLIALLERMISAKQAVLPELPVFSGRSDLPDFSGWKKQIEDALHAFEDGPLTKVVLARESSFHASAAVDPIALMCLLADTAPDTTLFCFQPASCRAFLGASPERLYHRRGVHMQTEALAGTRPRGLDPAEDARLEKELVCSKKEQQEHAIVVESLLTTLDNFAVELQYPGKPAIKKLAHCQHLYTPVRVRLEQGVSDSFLLRQLHPTPAVGGYPKKEALQYLREHEPFERGIFAAPVGWIARDSADFFVGIRSAAVLGNRLCLYAGAGIVPDSVAEEEWRELDAKIHQFAGVIEGRMHES
ncbi:MAG TPA: isochorismate synthase [Candidatus Hydrogenedentes bacterium]|jgi:menaquinone-specific isochorismate synthase|nr:MAG: Salicylate biosynthesis isochorismate synthase [Candidatus Hydrogenedentes bacterium ADurb.Bin170]HOD95138.1 isochorismate synthase [Candidatus Hydrogenedentota bacterium]HOM47118.1 isochorismate synthase [Candidatus Hydrogenedentota bacterium]HOR50569.1 isochorismate synthase [Candidatus Hydrogenedentota bacterium]HPK24784.1 isochorismate synthase [Candidatus Hydrogenedentota bacterium]